MCVCALHAFVLETATHQQLIGFGTYSFRDCDFVHSRRNPFEQKNEARVS